MIRKSESAITIQSRNLVPKKFEISMCRREAGIQTGLVINTDTGNWIDPHVFLA